MAAQALPILSYHTGAGWAQHGFATTVEQAKRVITKLLSDAEKQLIAKHGFQLSVQRRTELQRELNGGPDGFIWGVGKNCPAHSSYVKVQ